MVFACDVSGVRVGDESSLAEKQIALMGGKVGWIKVNSAFVGGGHNLTTAVTATGAKLWTDLKWHDVPNTVASYVSEAVGIRGLSLFNVHASGGPKMLKAVMDKLSGLFPADEMVQRPMAIAITVLTSISEEEFKQMGHTCTIAEQVMRLARLTKDAGLDGVVASPLEAKMLRAEFGQDFLIVTPGIRFAEEAKDGQARVATPKEAIANGADMVVMSTSLIKGGFKAVERAYREIEEGLLSRVT